MLLAIDPWASATALVSFAEAHPSSSLALAWEHSGQFWVKTGEALARHWAALLLFAAIPACARGYIRLRRGLLSPGRLALLDLLVVFARVWFCIVAVWASCTGNEWRDLSGRVGAVAAWQVGLGMVGVNVAHRLRMVSWEILFFVVVFFAADVILRTLVLSLGLGIPWLHDQRHRQAARVLLVNLILVPTAVIYLVEIGRPLFHQ